MPKLISTLQVPVVPDRSRNNFKFREEECAALKGEVEESRVSLSEVSDQMLDLYNTDNWGEGDGTKKIVEYHRLHLRHTQLSSDLQRGEKMVERYEDHRPVMGKSWRDDSLRRFLLGGSKMLDPTEIATFIGPQDISAEMKESNPLLGSVAGELYYVGGVAEHLPSKAPQLAVTDPYRSDVDGDGTTPAGGLAAPETWDPSLTERLKYFGSVARVAQNFSTENGNERHFPQLDSTAAEGSSIVDQTQTAGTGIPGDPKQLANVTDIVFRGYWRDSDFMDVRYEAFTDLRFDVAGRHERELMRRMGRGWNHWFTDADGASKPQGIVPSAKVVDGAAGSIDAAGKGVDYENLLDMEYAVDLSYLEGDGEGDDGGFQDTYDGMIGFMLNRNVERVLRRMKDGDNRPLWTPSLMQGHAVQGRPGNINGYPYVINNHMDDGKTTDDIPMLFGSFGHYGVRNIGGMMIFRFEDSETVKRMAIRFFAMSRRDGRCFGPLVSSKCDAYVGLQVKT